MSRIIKSIDRAVLEKTAERCRDRGIIIPTFAQLADPTLVPKRVRDLLPGVGMGDVNPLNLFRITWKNDVETGHYGEVNYLELPPEITGVKARIVALLGKYFPTGAHKVGAAFGCLVPRLVSGGFDPTRDKAVWPSTGNYCRGGAFDCALLDCEAIAILPEEMSKERFEWLEEIGAQVHATPGCESNVKEIYDKCWELKSDPSNVIFNQFEEFGNPIFHYNVTGPAIAEAFEKLRGDRDRLAAFVSSTGSAGTIAAGDFLKTRYAGARTVAAEALQCPTLYMNGYGAHRIEGIGDKHVPWVHNSRSTDAVAAIDDEDCMRVLRLFNSEPGRDYLSSQGVDDQTIESLPLIGISGIANLIGAIKTARYYEMEEEDIIVTVFTDSMELYGSRIRELDREHGPYNTLLAAADFDSCLLRQRIDYFAELNHYDRKSIHNLKYFTWIEQQRLDVAELDEQWSTEYWRSLFEDEVVYFDKLIEEFNELVGL